jgi:hypothetical protein
MQEYGTIYEHINPMTWSATLYYTRWLNSKTEFIIIRLFMKRRECTCASFISCFDEDILDKFCESFEQRQDKG